MSVDLPPADPPTPDDVRRAAARLDGHALRTPVVRSPTLDEMAGAALFVKCEHRQRGGAFKFRGAMNAVLSLSDEEAARGVAAHSSGNHAAALALAASMRGIPAHLVMPTTTPKVKLDAVAAAGGEITLCEPMLAAREESLAEVLARTGATEIHPYDDPRVIAGAGTAALELLDEVAGLTHVIAPVSGGGLLSGTAVAAHGIDPTIAVLGAEPTGADDAHRSLASGRHVTGLASRTIADGLLAELSPRTYGILREHDATVVTVSEREILDAMRLTLDHLGEVVEPSAAVAIAGVLTAGLPVGSRVGVISTGSNVDRHRFPFLVDHAAERGRDTPA